MSFCCLIKGIYPTIRILRVRVKINKRSFEPFCVWALLLGQTGSQPLAYVPLLFNCTEAVQKYAFLLYRSSNITRFCTSKLAVARNSLWHEYVLFLIVQKYESFGESHYCENLKPLLCENHCSTKSNERWNQGAKHQSAIGMY